MLRYVLHCATHSSNALSPFVLTLAFILTLTFTLPTSPSSTLSTWLFLTGTERTLCLTLASLTSQARAEGIRSKPTLRARLSGLNCARSPSGRLWVRLNRWQLSWPSRSTDSVGWNIHVHNILHVTILSYYTILYCILLYYIASCFVIYSYAYYTISWHIIL